MSIIGYLVNKATQLLILEQSLVLPSHYNSGCEMV